MKLCVLFPIFLVGCPSPSAPRAGDVDATPSSSDAPWDASASALRCCANLVNLGCAEGRSEYCARTVDLYVVDKLVRYDVECCANAGTKNTVRMCSPSIVCE